MSQETKMKTDQVGLKEKELKEFRKFISQFIYYPHGIAYERLSNKKIKKCDGCEADIDGIVEEVECLILNKIDERNAEVKQAIPNIIEDCVIIKMKDIPEHMVGIDLTWLDREIGRIKNRLEQQFMQKLGLDN